MAERYALLNPDHSLRHTEDPIEWGRAFNDSEARRVGRDEVGGYRVSTVFLGLDHSFGQGPGLYFETMLFGDGPRDLETYRYATWTEAEKGHKRLVADLRGDTELCQLCHEREATQRIEYTFSRDIVPVCDICAERGEEAESL